MNQQDRRFRQVVATACLSICALMAAPAAVAADSLVPHTAEYKLRISVLGGRLRTRVEQTEDGYRAESSIKATGMSRMLARGSIIESSVIQKTNEGLLPQHFLSEDSLSKNGQSVDLAFDWDENEIGGTIDGAEFMTELNGVVHDRVSLQYGLMDDLLRGVERSSYALQDAERLKLLSITNVGTKRVKVPFGRFDAIGIQHQAENSSRTTTLWCVEELGFLPVVIEQHRKGKRQMRAELTKYVEL